MGQGSYKSRPPPPIPERGIYSNRYWDTRVVAQMIVERKLAPIEVGTDQPAKPADEECPICFLWYTLGLNSTKCCRRPICSECLLQVRPNINKTFPLRKCPYCNFEMVSTVFKGPNLARGRTEERPKSHDTPRAKTGQQQRILATPRRILTSSKEDSEMLPSEQIRLGKAKALYGCRDRSTSLVVTDAGSGASFVTLITQPGVPACVRSPDRAAHDPTLHMKMKEAAMTSMVSQPEEPESLGPDSA